MGRASDLLLRRQSAAAYELMSSRARGLTEDESFWEPVADGWRVFRGPAGAE